MTATPPNLSYLTIYNPTLRSTGPVQDDDDDVEEQAQILFYTSKERAVSRDRMLRQVGLAKALVSFSECVCNVSVTGMDADMSWFGTGCSIPKMLARTSIRKQEE